MASTVSLTLPVNQVDGKLSGRQVFPMRAGYFTPAKMPLNLVYPRPDGETQAHARHKWAHSGFEYQIPIGVQGGAWPFKYEITSGPAGATIGQLYGQANYGVVTWSPGGATGTQNFTVRITDQQLNTIDATWSVTVDDSKFVFVQAGYAGTKVGTITQPLALFSDWYKDSKADATYLNKIIVWRSGLYTVASNNAEDSANVVLSATTKTPSLIGFPGELVRFNCAAAKLIDSTSNINDVFISGIKFENGRSNVLNSHFIWLAAVSSRITIWKNTFDTIGMGTNGGDNPCPVFISDIGTLKNYAYLADNEFLNINNAAANNGSYIDIYVTSNVVIERNLAHDSNTAWGFWCKGTVAFVSVRGNTAVANVTGKGFCLGYGTECGQVPHDHEVCFNNFNSIGDVCNFSMSPGYTGQSYNTWIYRNTLQSTTGGICQYVGAENFEVDANMLNFAVYTNWNEAIQTSAVANIKSATAVDAAGNNTGATGFGTHGWKPI